MKSICVEEYWNKFWFAENGINHRIDGPAVEWADGEKEWWIYGVEFTEEGFNRLFNYPIFSAYSFCIDEKYYSIYYTSEGLLFFISRRGEKLKKATEQEFKNDLLKGML